MEAAVVAGVVLFLIFAVMDYQESTLRNAPRNTDPATPAATGEPEKGNDDA